MTCDENERDFIYWCYIGAIMGDDDPENTLTAALTMKELCLIGLGRLLIQRTYPELDKHLMSLDSKLDELWVAQKETAE